MGGRESGKSIVLSVPAELMGIISKFCTVSGSKNLSPLPCTLVELNHEEKTLPQSTIYLELMDGVNIK